MRSSNQLFHRKFSKFLLKHGYLNGKQTRRSNVNITGAILGFQRFYKLEQTGKLDNETLREMRRPRCGNPDFGRRSGKMRKFCL
ncbi:matrix metalloproteinase-14-like protein [Dinothrombium tinctorium]|uniref:Matrix metalloproteinase-14-like protein n=1 Tax=Dinothrombium tinctorium TaxID=1965070 RepID=A0A3S3NJW2_9ACAR|nr:matrix metalloproteinase-14-like protein [Dinothrombium tinctorium]